jgi:hypothetical protein
MGMFVKDIIIPHIRDAKTSSETWQALNNLYQTNNTNHIIFLKSKLLSIKMDINESVNAFLGLIKVMKDKLGDIGEIVSNIDLVTISLNAMLEDYQMFITGLASREKAPTFEELTSILLQEEERHANLKPLNSNLALWTKKKFPKGKPREGGRGGSSFKRKSNPNQGMPPNKNEPK